MQENALKSSDRSLDIAGIISIFIFINFFLQCFVSPGKGAVPGPVRAAPLGGIMHGSLRPAGEGAQQIRKEKI